MGDRESRRRFTKLTLRAALSPLLTDI